MQDAVRQKIYFIISLIQCVGFVLFILIVWHITLTNILSYQRHKNIHLSHLLVQKENETRTSLEGQQNSHELNLRLRFITSLRQQNNQAGYLLIKINDAIPKTILFERLKREGSVLILEGKAKSDSDIVRLMENIAALPFFKQPIITAIGIKNQDRYFQLKIWMK